MLPESPSNNRFKQFSCRSLKGIANSRKAMTCFILQNQIATEKTSRNPRFCKAFRHFFSRLYKDRLNYRGYFNDMNELWKFCTVVKIKFKLSGNFTNLRNYVKHSEIRCAILRIYTCSGRIVWNAEVRSRFQSSGGARAVKARKRHLKTQRAGRNSQPAFLPALFIY